MLKGGNASANTESSPDAQLLEELKQLRNENRALKQQLPDKDMQRSQYTFGTSRANLSQADQHEEDVR